MVIITFLFPLYDYNVVYGFILIQKSYSIYVRMICNTFEATFNFIFKNSCFFLWNRNMIHYNKSFRGEKASIKQYFTRSPRYKNTFLFCIFIIQKGLCTTSHKLKFFFRLFFHELMKKRCCSSGHKTIHANNSFSLFYMIYIHKQIMRKLSLLSKILYNREGNANKR